MATVFWLPLTDFLALLGINLVLCAGFFWLFQSKRAASPLISWLKWAVVILFVALWLPAGSALIPLVAYVRGITSDLSVTFVFLACIGLYQRWTGKMIFEAREKRAVYAVLAVTAVILYPLALGWGDLDVYRAGWGSFVMWGCLLVLAIFSWTRGLRLLPLLVAAGLLAWSARLMESGNLFDYLIDPWIAVGALAASAKAAINRVLRPQGRSSGAGASPPVGIIGKAESRQSRSV